MAQKEQQKDFDMLVKVILVGDSGVGKSSIIQRFSDNVFNTNKLATIGVDFCIKTLQVLDKKVKLQIWDQAGQERFKSITASYYRGTNGIFIVFDQNNPSSYKNVKNWIQEVNKYSNTDTIRIILGNKSDLESKIPKEKITKISQKYGFEYFEASAKDNINIEPAFRRICEKIIMKNDDTVSKKAESFIQKLGQYDNDYSYLLKNPLTEGGGGKQSQELSFRIDEQGVVHFFPKQKLGQNYLKFCNKYQKPLKQDEIQEIVKKYTEHTTQYCTTINLLLASDHQNIQKESEYIRKLKWAVGYLANVFPVQNLQVFRGLNCSQKEFESYVVGKSFFIPSFLSTSKNPTKFYANANQNCLIVVYLKYKPGNAFVVNSSYSNYSQDEEEVLFSAYSKFKVISKQQNYTFNGKKFDFFIEVIHQNQRFFITT